MNIHISTYLIFEVFFIFLVWALVFLPPVVIFVDKLYLGARGLCFFNLIFVRREGFDESVLRHEMTHTRQQRKYSPWGVAIFILWHYFIKRKSWHQFWIEQEAVEAMNSDEKILRYFALNKKDS